MAQEIEAGTREQPKASQEAPDERLPLTLKIKNWVKDDLRHTTEWRKSARDAYDMAAGRQWTKSEESAFKGAGKVPLQFNRVLSIVKTVAGHEIGNRNELKFFPRGVEDTATNDVLNAANGWMADGCDAEDEQSDAFEDTVICGMGWTEHHLARDMDPMGLYKETRIDPLEMAWDCKSKARNLTDARRIHRIRKDIDIEEARAMFPGVEDVALDATWVMGEDAEGSDPVPIEERREHVSGIDRDMMNLLTKRVTIVETQWWELEPVHMVGQPGSKEMVEMDPAQFATFRSRAKEIGFSFKSAKIMRRVYYRAFMGAGLLRKSKSPVAMSFSYTAITGERDRNEGTWFGFVQVMHDPQKFANKMLSNTLHLMNVQAKGGVMAEKSAFEDERQAEATWAHPSDITWLSDGALSGQKPKLQEKPVAQFPAGYWQMLEFGISSIRDTAGVNLELLGMSDRNQPGILEAQRKQAGLTILGTLFNSLRRFRKQVGRIRLSFIQNIFSDGRLIRVTGPMGAKAVPLAKEKTSGQYDVVVDESANSASSKQETWLMIVQLLPLVQNQLSPRMMLQLLRYSPLPESLVNEIEQIAGKEAEDPEAAQKAKVQQDALLRSLMAQVAKDEASTGKLEAETQETLADTAKTVAETQQMGTVMDPNVQALIKAAVQAGLDADRHDLSVEKEAVGADLKVRDQDLRSLQQASRGQITPNEVQELLG